MAAGKRGFTLVEVLVLIAITAILAAILFTVFTRAREKARESTCLDNLKQLAFGVLMYADDWDGRAPGAGCAWGYWQTGKPLGGNERLSWLVLVDRYVGNRGVFTCPAREKWCVAGSANPDQVCVYGVALPDDWRGVSVGYTMNQLLGQSVPPNTDPDGEKGPRVWWDCTQWGGKNFKRLTRPADVMMLAEANNLGDNCGWKVNWPRVCGQDYDPCWDESGTGGRLAENAAHGGGNNWAFADGHVKWVRADAYECDEGEVDATEKEILSGPTLQRVFGVDQLKAGAAPAPAAEPTEPQASAEPGEG